MALRGQEKEIFDWGNDFCVGSGEIEFDEFLVLVSRFVVEGDKAKMEQELRDAFRLYDKQGNGYINVSDLREILRALEDKITEEELDEMIAEIDTDGSGTVDFDGEKTNVDQATALTRIKIKCETLDQNVSQTSRIWLPRP